MYCSFGVLTQRLSYLVVAIALGRFGSVSKRYQSVHRPDLFILLICDYIFPLRYMLFKDEMTAKALQIPSHVPKISTCLFSAQHLARSHPFFPLIFMGHSADFLRATIPSEMLFSCHTM